jgi:hypothetical protein
LDPLKESFAQGSVVSRSSTQIRVAFREHFDELDEGEWRIDVGRSNIVYERMRNAIEHLNHDPQQLEAAAMSADRELILQGTHLRDILLRSSQPDETKNEPEEDTFQPESAFVADEGALRVEEPASAADMSGAFKDDQRIHSWARRYSQPDPIVMDGDPLLLGLNTTQIRAVALMISQRLSLIQGVRIFLSALSFFHFHFQPPGTGKTKTIIETIKLLKVLGFPVC